MTQIKYTYKTSMPEPKVKIYQIKIENVFIKAELEKQIQKAVENVEVEGFRKGNAPREIAEKKIDRSKIIKLVIKNIVPELLNDLIKKENLQPFLNPKIVLNKLNENEDWELTITFVEKPAFKIPDYKAIIQKVKNELKTTAIWTPGKKENETEKDESSRTNKLLNAIFNELIKETQISLPKILVEEEVAKRLSNLLDELKKLGLTLDSYLASKQITAETLRAQHEKEIRDLYTLELVLSEIADLENITVTQNDIEVFISSIENESKREEIRKNSYYYAALLRRQKLLDLLISL